MPNLQPDDSKSDILIVDDALPNLQVLSAMLKEHGYNVRGVATGPAALMVANAKPPDLILLDVRMPDMDGYQVCRRLKADEKTRDVPVIFISALDDLADKVQGFVVGGVDYITKPVQVEEVLARVQTHLALRNLQRQLEAKNARLEQEIVEREQAEVALQRAHDELEQRVAERTAELTETVAQAKRLNEQLKREKEKAQQYLDVAGVAFIVLDSDGHITLVNKRGLRLLCYQEAELIGRNWFKTCVPERLREQVHSVFARLMAGEIEPVEYYENPALTKGGAERIVAWHNAILRDAAGNIVGTLSSGEDITERVRAEKEIRRRNRELALLNRVIAAYTSTLDVEQVLQIACQELARAFDLPQAAAALLNVERTALTVIAEHLAAGRPSALGKIIPVEGNPAMEYVLAHKAPLAMTEAQTDERMALVHDLMRERGTFSLLIVPVMERGEVVGTIGLDAVERREFSDEEVALAQNVAAATGQALETARLYRELQRHTAELARALEQQQELDRLRSEFIRNVSHELRTPLAIARGHAELLELGVLGELQPEQHESATIIARRMRMLSRVMGDLEAIIDTEMELKRRPVDLGELTYSLLNDSQTRGSAEQTNLALSVEIAPDLSPISGDPIQLRRVVHNLLDNALKFTPAGGHVTVHLRQEGENLVLEVSDTGIGIPDDQLERIFERFYQIDGSTTRRYGGTGLGLALVKEIVEAHEGQVTVRSAPGKGSAFVVTLPICSIDLPYHAQLDG